LKVERKGFFSKKRGFEETLLSILLNVSSLHLVFLEKGSMILLTKGFPNYHPNYLWVFIFRVAEKVSSLHLVFLEKVVDTMFQNIFQVIIQIIYRFYF